MKAVDKEKLWDEYRKKPSQAVREQLIVEYAQLVKLVAGRLSMYLGHNVEYEDLVSYGIFGLIDAIDKFDMAKNVKFETYASLRIRGAILDQIRRMDWLPRTVRQKQKRIDAAYNKIELAEGRMATDEEVAEELLAGQRYIKASRRRVYRNKAHFSLDAEDGIEYSACFSNPSPQELIERMERFEYLCHALNSLPDAQGQRVFEHYLLGHSVKAIAVAEGVTERAVSAAIQRGLENMKKYLKNVL